ncbi:AAA family ATPase [Moheibacter sediminis]|uniref:AAA ATPase domain-containing protein n=1 Tax=Moheibacter sediminis TaxID=1434700 RepID=A0A1W2AF86_9FLAO|nr:AAA family ATPase [Moheibacter sediminis]SMC59336.1 AAA ATPase domain-containing protein [Moheibacter sediminis]
MQLLNLYIKDYKLLSDFEINFTEGFQNEDTFNVIIGENGAGKTTLLEGILKIFGNLYEANTLQDIEKKIKSIDFKFTISYFIRAERVLEETSISKDSRIDYIKLQFSNIDKNWIRLEYTDSIFDNDDVNNFLFKTQYLVKDLLPKNVVLYYAGFDGRLSKLTQKFTYDFFKDWFTFVSEDSDKQTLGLNINAPIFHFNPNQFNLLLFSLFCKESGDVYKFIREKFGIVGFTDITLVLKSPSWSKGSSKEFWGAKGIIKDALDKFNKASQESEFLKRGISFSYFIPDVLFNLSGYSTDDSFASEKDIFQTLLALDIMGLLDKVQITLVKEIAPEKNIEISSQDLSEGEKQLLSIYGLKQIISTNDESLFLFDEPDTFLHPKWKKEFFKNLYYDTDGVKSTFNDFDIITTHSPEIIGGIKHNILLRRLMEGKVSDKEYFVKGRDYNSILFEAFGTEKSSDIGKDLLSSFYDFLESKQLDKAKQVLDNIINERGLDDIETQRALDNFDDYD